MLTWSSRLRGGLMCGALSLAACSLDTRTLSSASAPAPQGTGGRTLDESPSIAGASAIGAGGDDSIEAGGADADAPSSSATCSGGPRERRCAIAGGSFLLDPRGNATPASIASFALDELEVTVGRFRKYVTSFSGAPAADDGAHPEIAHSGWRSSWNALLPTTKDGLIATLHCNADWETWTDDAQDREDYPLTCASYYVAFAFCAWSGGRLPTEAEWEYAASGGAQQRRYPWGNGEPSSELALFDSAAIAPAGGHRAGMARFGQLDLAGSAWEWTLDYFRDYPEECAQCAEVDRGSERVLRGGAFLYGADYLEPTYRYHMDPQLALGDVGFRCAYGP
ncbi:MAG TPA: SUMF1/EgtB/PvdO family nonheme iron enzyme [Polyangiaceae bacterium]|nr:SUMF1/EgtB/PvdO family nonheme iron enzyme [Polyangiaceae bacterium]